MDLFYKGVWTTLLIIIFSPSIAQQSSAPSELSGQIPTLYEQLCSVNKEWRVQPADLPGLHQAADHGALAHSPGPADDDDDAHASPSASANAA